jgi:RNA polymerase-binding transcription factor DksA
LFDRDDPSADADGASALLLIQQAEERYWEVEQALARLDNGTYGYCVNCGARIGLERLQALPATPTCIACSRRSSRRIPARIGTDPGVARRAHHKSPPNRDGSESEVEQ